MILYRITSPYFCAGIEVDSGGRVFRTAPILRYAFKLGTVKFLNYANRKGWSIEMCDAIDCRWKSIP